MVLNIDEDINVMILLFYHMMFLFIKQKGMMRATCCIIGFIVLYCGSIRG